MVSDQDVINGYRMILGREPENEAAVIFHAMRHLSLRDLREAFFTSAEFREIYWSICSGRCDRDWNNPDPADDNPLPAEESDIRDRAFWWKYLPPGENENSPVPFREMGFQRYLTDRGLAVHSTLSSFELAFLYALARDYSTGRGAIVDLGCQYGLSTRCLAKGLADNKRLPPVKKHQCIYAFDSFLTGDLVGSSASSSTSYAGSIFYEFLMLNQEFLRNIVPCPGDIRRMNWSLPIEILFIGHTKLSELSRWVIVSMFPWLIEGAIVIQPLNDEYWVHITMEYYSDWFEPLYMTCAEAAAYRCKRAISSEALEVDLATLSAQAKEALLNRALEKAPPTVREVVKCAYAKFLLEEGQADRAAAMVESVITEPSAIGSALEVAAIAAASKEKVRQLIASAVD